MDDLKRLYKYYPSVKKFIRDNSGSSEEAEDIFQEALFVYWKNTSSKNFTLTVKPETYLFAICKNLWKLELRAKKKILTQSSSVPEQFEINDSETINKEYIANKAYNFLNEKCKQILNLFYYGGLSLNEIAKKFGMVSDVAAKNQKYQCLEKARAKYNELSNNINH